MSVLTGATVNSPIHEAAAVNMTSRFLADLTRPQDTPRVPKWIRERARDCLVYYPSERRVTDVWQHEWRKETK